MPFDYYRDGGEEEDKDDFEETGAFLELNTKLGKLQEFLHEMKGILSGKSDQSNGISPTGPANGISTKGSEQGDIKSDPATNSIQQLPENQTDLNSLNIETRPKKKSLQIMTNSQESKTSDRKATHRHAETNENRKNISVFFGHENWNLVLNMMIGLRTSIKGIEPRNFFEKLHDNEFKLKSHFDLIQKRTAGFDIRKACKFFDFFPHVFEDIRRKYGINSREFLKSCGPESLLVKHQLVQF